jgi:hypothetical protein
LSEEVTSGVADTILQVISYNQSTFHTFHSIIRVCVSHGAKSNHDHTHAHTLYPHVVIDGGVGPRVIDHGIVADTTTHVAVSGQSFVTVKRYVTIPL